MADNIIAPLWVTWPPQKDVWRLDLYALYRAVLLGEHREVFGQASKRQPSSELSGVVNAVYLKGEKENTPYVVLNYCKTVATTFASKMFGTPPEYRVGGDEDYGQQRLKVIVTDNTLNNTNIEQAISCVAMGDCVYRVRYGKMRNWKEPLPIIEAIPSKNFFAITAPDNVKEVLAIVLAFAFEYGDIEYLKLEIHKPNAVVHELWALSGGKLDKLLPFGDLAEQFPALLESVAQYANITMDEHGRVIEDTGYPGMLVEYVPNFLLPDEFYGHSDYDNLLSIQDDINKTGTGILQVILKHIDPKLILPPGTMQYDEKRDKWFVVKEDMEVVEVPAEVGAVLPRYVTWDAQLGAARANMEALFEAFMIISDISLPMLGITKYGTAESGTALELKMTQTTDAVNRKRMYFDTALKNILYAAQWLDVHYGKQQYEPKEVSIQWPSPVPMDRVTETDMHVTRVEAGIESRRTAVAAVQKLEDDALDAELNEIAEDKAMGAAAFTAASRAVSTGDEDEVDDPESAVI